MVHIRCDKGAVMQDIDGTVSEVGADLMVMIHTIYLSVYNHSPIDSVIFRQYIKDNIDRALALDNDDFKILKKMSTKEDTENE